MPLVGHIRDKRDQRITRLDIWAHLGHERMSVALEISRSRKTILRRELLVERPSTFSSSVRTSLVCTEAVRENAETASVARRNIRSCDQERELRRMWRTSSRVDGSVRS
ncbi:hypothetical protein AAFG07_32055 [Bradyrhizobium sp. B097]|uniref:hypothetical protein n=1 Tax=Bradyrhizobium sp. B097 TaxID=3140244 RepID=UPI0031841977